MYKTLYQCKNCQYEYRSSAKRPRCKQCGSSKRKEVDLQQEMDLIIEEEKVITVEPLETVVEKAIEKPVEKSSTKEKKSTKKVVEYKNPTHTTTKATKFTPEPDIIKLNKEVAQLKKTIEELEKRINRFTLKHYLPVACIEITLSIVLLYFLFR